MEHQVGQHKNEDIILALSWPDTFSAKAYAWYDKPIEMMGIVGGAKYKVGHAALVLIERETGTADYYDFGRYITPDGCGRVRYTATDPDVHFPLNAEFGEDGKLLNLKDMLNMLSSSPLATHGEGRMVVGVNDDYNYKKGKAFVDKLINRGSLPYGPFVWNGTNCSRFVSDAIIAGVKSIRLKLKSKFQPTITASPLGNCVFAGKSIYVWEAEHGNITYFPGGTLKVAKEVYRGFGVHYTGENTGPQKEPDRTQFGLDDTADWLCGQSGVWFELSKPEGLLEKQYRIRRIAPDGYIDSDGIFDCKEDGFKHEDPFQFVFDSNSRFCNIQQGGKGFYFKFTQEYGEKALEDYTRFSPL